MYSLRNLLVLIIVSSFMLGGCAIKPPVTSDYDTNYEFTKLKKYAWIMPSDPSKVETLDSQRDNNAIETILNRKGFTKVSETSTADFLLKTHMVTDKKVDVDRFYSTWGYNPYFHPYASPFHAYPWPHNSSTTVVRERQVGTLVLDIVDPVKKSVIWRGTVSSTLGIYKNRTPEERGTKALKNAEAMLESFPPGQTSTE